MIRLFATLALATLMVAAPATVRATAQMSDIVVVDGKQYGLNTNPLERYLESLGDRAPKFDSPHTANWRGYVATWELADDALYLRQVEGYRTNPKPDDDDDTEDHVLTVDGMAELFPGHKEVLADWYTGALIIPDGELVDYVHMGYGSTYERYIVAIVREGREMERRTLSLAEFEAYREEKFARFKETDAYRRHLAESRARADGLSDAQLENFIREFEAERYLSAP